MNPKILYQWIEEITMQIPSLNSWQAENLGLFSYGVVESESSQQMAIARKVVCGEQVMSAERRLRRFIANQSLDMESFFIEWTRWISRQMSGRELVLLVDETKIKDHLGIMVVGIAYEGRCVPVAWRCYRANDSEAYPSEGQVKMIEGLLKLVQAGLSADHSVLVLADRGIGTSPELCRAVDEMGWRYLFRVTKQSKIITDEGEYTIYEQVNEGDTWQASGTVFKKRGRIPAHARALWSEGYNEPWALVTNDETLTGYEYAERNWQEQGFRDLKSGGWHWESSYVRSAEHMMHFLMILVVAYAWVLGVGSYAVHWQKARSLTCNPNGQPRRVWSLFKEGLNLFVDYMQRNSVCLKPCFVSDKRLL